MSAKDTPICCKNTLNCNGSIVFLDEPIVMGILNITPDSFYDGGKYLEENQILKRVIKIINEGARIIDIGAFSTRPGAKTISTDEELNRIIPVIRQIKSIFPRTLISVDTFRSLVARQSIEAGASLINDISGGEMDESMFETVRELNVPYILTHIKGTPQTMQSNPKYADVVLEIISYFHKKIILLQRLGVSDIILDPGFGFGKTIDHNFEILKRLDEFTIFNLPIMVGISRKSMIYKTLNSTPDDALNGTLSLDTIALQKGAKILRVHDVKEAVEITKLVKKM